MTETEGGTTVYLKDWNGTDWYLSPGCTITETLNMGVNNSGAMSGNPVIWVNISDIAHTIRIDGSCYIYSDEDGNGLTNWPYIPRWGFLSIVTSNAGNNEWTLYMGAEPYVKGQVKNVTFTRRSGEGNLMDYAITFEVGELDPT